MTTKHWRIALIVWMIIIFIASSSLLSSENTEQVLVYDLLNYSIRKLAHIVEYAILAYLWFRSLYPKPKQFKPAVFYSVLLSILYAITDEWHQSFVPNRLGIWTDVVWDTAGAIIMGILLWYVNHWGKEKTRQKLLGIQEGEQV